MSASHVVIFSPIHSFSTPSFIPFVSDSLRIHAGYLLLLMYCETLPTINVDPNIGNVSLVFG